ncbi:MAG: hypothetical protein IKP58_16835 [Victivallales bacterium]|nr:hypothetical protein [Victivallales bacterium]
MNINKDLISQFQATSNQTFPKKTIARGYWLLFRRQGIKFTFQLLWEFLTLVLAYAPATDMLHTVVETINNKWEQIPNAERECLLAALHSLDKHGEVSLIFKDNTT